jgi:hypothetical protein
MGERRNEYGILMDKLEERKAIERPRCVCTWEGLLKLILNKQGGRLWNDFIWLRIEITGGLMGKRG